MNAIVTGASKGIGRAIAIELAKRRFRLLLCARHMAGLENLAEELVAAHPNIELLLVEADCSRAADCTDLASRTLEEWNAVDVLVNNVGMYSMGSFSETSAAAMSTVMDSNFFSAYNLSHAIAPAMISAGSGHIFNICSVLSHEIRAEAAAYTISKQALYALSKVMAAELREHNIRVTAVLPGSVNTASWEGLNAPVSEFVQPADIASCIATVLDASPRAWFEEIIVRPISKDF